jgi:predicted ABC-type ATPase
MTDERPVLIALAGPNGAGKTSFYYEHLADEGLRFVNADEIARESGASSDDAARVTNQVREQLLEQRESFIFETVFSDPVGDKVAFLKRAVERGYAVVVVFVGVDSAQTSALRVELRVAKGGHDVPEDKLAPRYERTMENLKRAVRELPRVIVYDNSDFEERHRKVAEFADSKCVEKVHRAPEWLMRLGLLD